MMFSGLMAFALLVGQEATANAAEGAQGTRWQLIDEGADRSTYLDIRTVRRSGDRVIVWQRVEYPRPQRQGHSETVTRWEYDCRNRTSELLRFVDWRADGTVVMSHTLSSSEREAEPVAPDSVEEDVLEIVCR